VLTNVEQVRADPHRLVQLFDRDVSILIGMLALLEGEAQEDPPSRVIQPLVRDAARYGLLAVDAGAEDVVDVLSSMNQRLRAARGEYDGVA
jgi:hypothetical protein